MLDLSQGTIKSQASKGLARLRELLAADDYGCNRRERQHDCQHGRGRRERPGSRGEDLSLAYPPGAEPSFRTPVSALVATAIRRGRRRRIATQSAKAALFAVPVIAAVVVFANPSPRTVTTAVRPASSPSGLPSSTVADCAGAQLSGKVSRGAPSPLNHSRRLS